MYALYFPSTFPPIPCIYVSHLTYILLALSLSIWLPQLYGEKVPYRCRRQVSPEHQYRTTWYHIPDDHYPNNIYRSVQITKPIFWLYPVSWYYLPLGSIHSPQQMQSVLNWTVSVLLITTHNSCFLQNWVIEKMGKFTGAHHILMFHLPAANSINSKSSKRKFN